MTADPNPTRPTDRSVSIVPSNGCMSERAKKVLFSPQNRNWKRMRWLKVLKLNGISVLFCAIHSTRISSGKGEEECEMSLCRAAQNFALFLRIKLNCEWMNCSPAASKQQQRQQKKNRSITRDELMQRARPLYANAPTTLCACFISSYASVFRLSLWKTPDADIVRQSIITKALSDSIIQASPRILITTSNRIPAQLQTTLLAFRTETEKNDKTASALFRIIKWKSFVLVQLFFSVEW